MSSNGGRRKIPKPTKWLIVFIVFFVCLLFIGSIAFGAHLGIERRNNRIKAAEIKIEVKPYKEFLLDISNDNAKLEKYKYLDEATYNTLFRIIELEEPALSEIRYHPQLFEMGSFDIRDFLKTKSSYISMQLEHLTRNGENLNNQGDVFNLFHYYTKSYNPSTAIPISERITYQITLTKQGTKETKGYTLRFAEGTKLSFIYDGKRVAEERLRGVFPRGSFREEELKGENGFKKALAARAITGSDLTENTFWFFQKRDTVTTPIRIESLTNQKANDFNVSAGVRFINTIDNFHTNTKYNSVDYSSIIYYDIFEDYEDELVRFFVPKQNNPTNQAELLLHTFGARGEQELRTCINKDVLRFNLAKTSDNVPIYEFIEWRKDGSSFDFVENRGEIGDSDVIITPFANKIVYDIKFYTSKEAFLNNDDPFEIIKMHNREWQRPIRTTVTRENGEDYKIKYWVNAEGDVVENFFNNITILEDDYNLYPIVYGKVNLRFEFNNIPKEQTETLVLENPERYKGLSHYDVVDLPENIYTGQPNQLGTINLANHYDLKYWALKDNPAIKISKGGRYSIKHDSEESITVVFVAELQSRPVNFKIALENQNETEGYENSEILLAPMRVVSLANSSDSEVRISKADLSNIWLSFYRNLTEEDLKLHGFDIDESKLNEDAVGKYMKIDVSKKGVAEAKIYAKRITKAFNFHIATRSLRESGGQLLKSEEKTVTVTFGRKPNVDEIPIIAENSFWSYNFIGWSEAPIYFTHKGATTPTEILVGDTTKICSLDSFFADETKMIDYFSDNKLPNLYSSFEIKKFFSVDFRLQNTGGVSYNQVTIENVDHSRNIGLDDLGSHAYVTEGEGESERKVRKAYRLYNDYFQGGGVANPFNGTLLEDMQTIYVTYIEPTIFQIYDNGEKLSANLVKTFEFFISDGENAINNRIDNELRTIQPNQYKNKGNKLANIKVGSTGTNNSLLDPEYISTILQMTAIKEYDAFIIWEYYLYDVEVTYKGNTITVPYNENTTPSYAQTAIEYNHPHFKEGGCYYVEKFNGAIPSSNVNFNLNNYERQTAKLDVKDIKFKITFSNIGNVLGMHETIYLFSGDKLTAANSDKINNFYNAVLKLHTLNADIRSWPLLDKEGNVSSTLFGSVSGLTTSNVNAESIFKFEGSLVNLNMINPGEYEIKVKLKYSTIPNVKFELNIVDASTSSILTKQTVALDYNDQMIYNFSEPRFEQKFYETFSGTHYYYSSGLTKYRFSNILFENSAIANGVSENFNISSSPYLDHIEIGADSSRTIKFFFQYDKPVKVTCQDPIFTNNEVEEKYFYPGDIVSKTDYRKQVNYYDNTVGSEIIHTNYIEPAYITALNKEEIEIKRTMSELVLSLQHNYEKANLTFLCDVFDSSNQKEVRIREFDIYFNNAVNALAATTDFSLLKQAVTSSPRQLYPKAEGSIYNDGLNVYEVKYVLHPDNKVTVYLFAGTSDVVFKYYGVKDNKNSSQFLDYEYLGDHTVQFDIGTELNYANTNIQDIPVGGVHNSRNYFDYINKKPKGNVNVAGFYNLSYLEGIVEDGKTLVIPIFLESRKTGTLTYYYDIDNLSLFETAPIYHGTMITLDTFGNLGKEILYYDGDKAIEKRFVAYDCFTVGGPGQLTEHFYSGGDIYITLRYSDNYASTNLELHNDYLNAYNVLATATQNIKVYYLTGVTSFSSETNFKPLVVNNEEARPFLVLEQNNVNFNSKTTNYSLTAPVIYLKFKSHQVKYHFYGIKEIYTYDIGHRSNIDSYNALDVKTVDVKIGTSINTATPADNISLSVLSEHSDKDLYINTNSSYGRYDGNIPGYPNKLFVGYTGHDLNVYVFYVAYKQIEVTFSQPGFGQIKESFNVGKTFDLSYSDFKLNHLYYDGSKIGYGQSPSGFKQGITVNLTYTVPNSPSGKDSVELVYDYENFRTDFKIKYPLGETTTESSELKLYFNSNTTTYMLHDNVECSELFAHLEIADYDKYIIKNVSGSGGSRYNLKEINPRIIFEYKTGKLQLMYYGIKPDLGEGADLTNFGNYEPLVTAAFIKNVGTEINIIKEVSPGILTIEEEYMNAFLNIPDHPTYFTVNVRDDVSLMTYTLPTSGTIQSGLDLILYVFFCTRNTTTLTINQPTGAPEFYKGTDSLGFDSASNTWTFTRDMQSGYNLLSLSDAMLHSNDKLGWSIEGFFVGGGTTSETTMTLESNTYNLTVDFKKVIELQFKVVEQEPTSEVIILNGKKIHELFVKPQSTEEHLRGISSSQLILPENQFDVHANTYLKSIAAFNEFAYFSIDDGAFSNVTEELTEFNSTYHGYITESRVIYIEKYVKLNYKAYYVDLDNSIYVRKGDGINHYVSHPTKPAALEEGVLPGLDAAMTFTSRRFYNELVKENADQTKYIDAQNYLKGLNITTQKTVNIQEGTKKSEKTLNLSYKLHDEFMFIDFDNNNSNLIPDGRRYETTAIATTGDFINGSEKLQFKLSYGSVIYHNFNGMKLCHNPENTEAVHNYWTTVVHGDDYNGATVDIKTERSVLPRSAKWMIPYKNSSPAVYNYKKYADVYNAVDYMTNTSVPFKSLEHKKDILVPPYNFYSSKSGDTFSVKNSSTYFIKYFD